MSFTVRFVTCNDPVSAAIRAFEYGFWASHAEVLMPDGKLLGAHADGGVQERLKGYDAATMTQELYVPLPLSENEADKAYDFLLRQIGKSYDMTAIAAIVLQRDWREADSWFCSELVSAALETSGWFPFALASDVNHITPRDLLLILSSQVEIQPSSTGVKQ